jgi:hypothetical protein
MQGVVGKDLEGIGMGQGVREAIRRMRHGRTAPKPQGQGGPGCKMVPPPEHRLALSSSRRPDGSGVRLLKSQRVLPATWHGCPDCSSDESYFQQRRRQRVSSILSVRSKLWRSPALRMPERKDLDRHVPLKYTIVQMVMDAGKMNTADAGASPKIVSMRRWNKRNQSVAAGIRERRRGGRMTHLVDKTKVNREICTTAVRTR